MYVLHLCLKPETSEMQQKCFHAIVKVKIFSTFPAFPKGTLGSAVLKNRYFRPCLNVCFLSKSSVPSMLHCLVAIMMSWSENMVFLNQSPLNSSAPTK